VRREVVIHFSEPGFSAKISSSFFRIQSAVMDEHLLGPPTITATDSADFFGV
jgi:hypothetical protein